MKKYVLWGLLLGVAIGATVFLFHKRRAIENEFNQFFDSALAAEDLLGDVFAEFPDRP
jgi:DMSO reductase anchor subunit